MDAGERALLDTTVRRALAECDADADAVLADLGWFEMLDAERDDGIAVVFEALGATNAVSTALDDVLLSALGYKARADVAVAVPAFGAALASARVLRATELVLGSETVPAASVDVRAVHGIDPDARMFVVAVDATFDAEAVALGRRAVAHQLAGASRAMLELARAHALERVQFGRPVARFQAVRHRLADALVAIEALEAVLAAAADEPGAMTAALAKVTAGRTARTVATHCQQVLAGIGFTTDHLFHHYLKRTMLLDGLLGSADDVAVDIGRELVAARRVPTLIEL